MIQKVNRIAANPLQAAQEEENEALAIERYEEEMKKKNKSNSKKSDRKDGPFETVILE